MRVFWKVYEAVENTGDADLTARFDALMDDPFDEAAFGEFYYLIIESLVRSLK